MSHTPLPKHLLHKHIRRKSRRKEHLVGASIAALGLIAFAFSAFSYASVVAQTPKEVSSRLIPTPTPYYQNIALMGYGGGDHDGGALTDSIMVARVDDRAKKIFLISVPRDLWVELPFNDNNGNPVGTKINAAYALGLDDNYYSNKPEEYSEKNGGGGKLAKYALKQVIGDDINHFVSVSFKAFETLVDSLGGITITRTTTFSDPWYPVDGKEKDTCGKSEDDLKAIEATMSGYLKEQEFKCRYETITFEAGTKTLDGKTALKYARSRHSETEGNDFSRSQRQRQVVLAIKDKLLSFSSIPAIIDLAGKMFKYVDTDYKATDIPGLISLFMAKKDYEVDAIALTDQNVLKNWTGPNGEYALVPQNKNRDFLLIQEWLKDRYWGMSEASATARFDLIANPATPTTLQKDKSIKAEK
ncbi:MAG: LCP family protein [Patescibacteria group bacterium]